MHRLHLRLGCGGRRNFSLDGRYFMCNLFHGVLCQMIMIVEKYSSGESGNFARVSRRICSDVRCLTFFQFRAIVSAMFPGVTLVVGLPGSGKTMSVSIIVYLIYFNFTNQRTLLVAHSMRALNDVCLRLRMSDLPWRYLIRIGLSKT